MTRTEHTKEQALTLALFLKDYAGSAGYAGYADYAEYAGYAVLYARYAAKGAIKANAPPLIPLVYKALSL